MSLDLIKKRNEERRARAEKATAGPWAYKNLGDKGGNACGISTWVLDEENDKDEIELISGPIEEYYDSESEDFWDVDALGRRVIDIENICILDEGCQDPMGDGAFIASVRTDAPEAYDDVDRLADFAEKVILLHRTFSFTSREMRSKLNTLIEEL
jgi:hypothetical protein